ncbi:MAG: UDP-4-amino-4,6-dideoxy-N-acetyl-beta-L-altrosamine N-acetyltransferase [Halothiobacillus sp.]|nr:UDP-4-amino-4,6-dideoxy-N-acetyl-beta-L-altrosamine N-acetyltransferase [Halothiobacillus sp.]
MTPESIIFDRVRPMTTDDLALVLSWRNHPDIRRYMYTQHEIALTEHQSWFDRASENPHKHLLIFESGSNPQGFVQMIQLGGGPVAEWGFYASPDAPKGTGRRMGQAALRYAFEHIGLHKLCGQALAYNEPSIRFHRALGFQQEGLLRDQHHDGQCFHDVLCFGLLNSEWRTTD